MIEALARHKLVILLIGLAASHALDAGAILHKLPSGYIRSGSDDSSSWR